MTNNNIIGSNNKVGNTVNIKIAVGSTIIIIGIIGFIFIQYFVNPSNQIVGTWVNSEGDAMIFGSDGYLDDYYGVPCK